MPSPLSDDRPTSPPGNKTFPAPSIIPPVNGGLISNPTNIGYSTPSSASSATTSFRQDWLPDAGTSYPNNRRSDDIEMDSITPAGHRRRRSTLNGSIGSVPASTPRPRSESMRSTSAPGEPKISEENRDEDATKPEEPDDESFSDEDLHDDEETGLTREDKRRKREKQRRNTRLDNRIIRDKISDEERKEADQNVIRKVVTNTILIGLWYLFSLSISLYNKWMFDANQLGFAYPLFTTALHMLVQFSLASLVLFFIPSLRPQNAFHGSDPARSRRTLEPQKPAMTKMFYLTRIGPCGAATGLDIGLGNTSLKFITLTFYTMCKSSSLAFVLLFAFLFRLEAPTWKLVAIIGTMTLGVIMMVAGEVEFEFGGFVLVISAAFFSGFRWGLTQILLLRNPATSNPFSSIFFLAPVMFLTLLVIAIPVEGFSGLLEGLRGLSATWGTFLAPLILLFPGTLAFLMTAAEFALLQRSSVVTLSIAGIFKEVVTISAAALVFDDKLTPINLSGLMITISAIAAYNWIKFRKMRNDAQVEVHNQKGGGYQQGQSGSSSEGEDGGEEEEEEAGLLAGAARHDDDTATVTDEGLVTMDGDFIPSRPGEEERPPRTSEHAD